MRIREKTMNDYNPKKNTKNSSMPLIAVCRWGVSTLKHYRCTYVAMGFGGFGIA
jgi:hypothetical protein